ncbi:DUF2335 domain-containing protein [Limosilactobacillus fermentum]
MAIKDAESQITKSNSQEVDNAVDSVKKLPREQQDQVIQKLEMYSGPIPAPHILEQYDEIDPGAAKLIIENGVDESRHRRDMESKILEMSRKKDLRRDWMAIFMGSLAMVIGGFLIYKNHYVVGTIFSGISVIGLVGQFLGSDSDSNNGDTEEKSSDD